MTAHSSLKKAGCTLGTALLFSASQAWAAIPLTGPCDPDFGPPGSCQTSPKDSKTSGTRAKPATAPQSNGLPASAPTTPAKAPNGSISKVSSEPRSEPAPIPTAEEPGTRHQAPDAPEPVMPLNPGTHRPQ